MSTKADSSEHSISSHALNAKPPSPHKFWPGVNIAILSLISTVPFISESSTNSKVKDWSSSSISIPLSSIFINTSSSVMPVNPCVAIGLSLTGSISHVTTVVSCKYPSSLIISN